MARPKKTAVEKQQPAPVPMPPQHIQQYPQHPQPIAAVPQAMAVPMPAAVAAPPQAVMPQRVVDNDSFLRVRDSAVGRLTTILELLRSFTADYVRQTNLLLGEPTAEGSQDNLLANFEQAAQQLISIQPAELAPPVEEKKERKKRTIDPNAPKRPLTPYFLYMQHARSIIANDLGTEAPKGAVQEEGQRRWAHMGPHEKQGWNNAYQYNLRLYNARVHSYKNGNPLAKGMTDEEALKYAEDFQIPMPELKDVTQTEAPANDQDALTEQLQAVAAAPAAEEPEEAETPAKTPKKAAGGRKRKVATPAAAEEKPAPASPDKKRRRSTKAAAAAEPQEEPKKSGRKKTKSS
ncbi:high mobility group protein [Fusarium equiseti]|uniref:High mobility group protein n=1 Tax=Fusarium equiseti TaxID=61235 RepID=A0ABQ8RL46_FUSEQ|nr:high mobility group protein [Fusarium equiseti]